MFNKKNNTHQSFHDKRQLKQLFNDRIYFGPFSGLKIPDNLYDVLSVAEIMGLYESCLHNTFSDLLNRDIKNIILVGGNNGYYTAGLSYIFSPEQYYVYEMDHKMHNLIESWYVKNNMSLPKILGEADDKNFVNFDADIDLLLIDCEGAEKILLNPEKFLWQKRSDIILELHPFYVDNLIALISKRFSSTHEIQLIYDDFNEDGKINQILKGLNMNVLYPQHPTHRWIMEDGKKVFTSGSFMYLKRK